jgi:hypothetical protein
MDITGQDLIDVLCRELKERNILLYDSNIRILLSELTAGELREIITFGDVIKWRNIRVQNEKLRIETPQEQ